MERLYYSTAFAGEYLHFNSNKLQYASLLRLCPATHGARQCVTPSALLSDEIQAVGESTVDW